MLRGPLGWSWVFLVACKTTPVEVGEDTDGSDVPPDPAAVELAPCDMDFGDVAPGVTADRDVVVQNVGGSDLHVLDAAVTGATFSGGGGAGVVAPGGREVFAVTFAPVTVGAAAGELALHTDVEDVDCVLRGRGWLDADHDGFADAAVGGDDCNDHAAYIYPGAHEVWYDGTDGDCAGGNDFDQDGDGYESKVFNPDPTHGGGDCDDMDVERHPGLSDPPHDGIDSDCDGADG